MLTYFPTAWKGLVLCNLQAFEMVPTRQIRTGERPAGSTPRTATKDLPPKIGAAHLGAAAGSREGSTHGGNAGLDAGGATEQKSVASKQEFVKDADEKV
jgi:hypothetical protein